MNRTTIVASIAALLLGGVPAGADLILDWDGGNGLSAHAQFTVLGPRQLQVTVTNTSTAMPPEIAGDTSNQFLTSISFDLPGGVQIIGGSAILGPGAVTMNFDQVAVQLTEGADVSAEWGFSNTGDRMDLSRLVITTLQAQATPFSMSGNLDGSPNLNGPQGGLLADPPLMDIGGLGGIRGPVIFTLDLDGDIDLAAPGWTGGGIEFGSDAAFVYNPTFTHAPEPTTAALLVIGGLFLAAGSPAGRRLLRRRVQ